MIGKRWSVKESHWQAFVDGREALTSQYEELRSAFDESGERWRETEDGQAVEEWLDTLSAVLDEMGNVTQTPE